MAAKKPPPRRTGGGTAILLLVATTVISVLAINCFHPNNNMPSYPYQPAPTWCQPPAHCLTPGPPSAFPVGYKATAKPLPSVGQVP